MNSYVMAEATFDGSLPRLVDPGKYRADVVAKRWPAGKRLMLRIGPATRSEKANAYLWGVVYETIVKQSESGNTAEDLHDAFCERFILSEHKQVEFFNKMTGEHLVTDVTRRSSALQGGPFYDFVENIREFARQFWGIETPDPDPDYWRKR